MHIADHISGARPGARHEDFDQYLRRIRTLRVLRLLLRGVRDAYALQAGRELRVIVRPDEISDDDAFLLKRSKKALK